MDYSKINRDLSGMDKAVSRCGLLCGGCSYRQSHNCAGCIALEGRPFWGECPVAGCCQGKGYGHCGECPDIPCETLYDFSCGEGEHCDKPAGARIEVCKAWAANLTIENGGDLNG